MAALGDFFKRLAEAAAKETLPRFRLPHAVTNKLDTGFDPVTEADREAERRIRALIAQEFPDHGILGEEFGSENVDRSHVWVIDPIDGTRSYISGIPLWGTLVGLTAQGDAVAGMMSQPFLGELFHADETGAFYEGPAGRCRLATRDMRDVSQATMCTTTPALFRDGLRAGYDRLEQAARLSRYGTDCYAFAMLAAGQVDIVVEAGLQPYDIVALIPIIEQAGGIVTNFEGAAAEAGGNVIAAATPQLHAQALDLLNGS